MQEDTWHRLFFDDWLTREGLELTRGHKIDDVLTHPLRPWARLGGNAAHFQLDGTGELNASYIGEIPPGKQLNPIRHLYEELTYVVQGRGSTTVWYAGQRKNTFEWAAGSLFAIPLNAWHQHFNVSGSEPVRYFSITTAPSMMNFLRNEDFIFDNDFAFTERYAGQENYFSPDVREELFLGWDLPHPIHFSNYWPDINQVTLNRSEARGLGTATYAFELANGVLGAHMMEVPPGTFTKLHRHGPGSHVLWLRGEGYSVIWPDGGEMNQEYWGPGTVLVPPSGWWHQHCVVSNEPACHLALKLSSRKNLVTLANTRTLVSTKRGGNQMDYEDVPPAVMEELKQMFVDECTVRGTPMHMEPVFGL